MLWQPTFWMTRSHWECQSIIDIFVFVLFRYADLRNGWDIWNTVTHFGQSQDLCHFCQTITNQLRTSISPCIFSSTRATFLSWFNWCISLAFTLLVRVGCTVRGKPFPISAPSNRTVTSSSAPHFPHAGDEKLDTRQLKISTRILSIWKRSMNETL